MKSLILTIAVVLIMVSIGCEQGIKSYSQAQLEDNAEKNRLAYTRKQAELVVVFKGAYPNNWEEKLLEYELQQEIIREQKKMLYQRQAMVRRNQNRVAWKGFIQGMQQQNNHAMYEAQYNYYTRPYKDGNVTYVPYRR